MTKDLWEADTFEGVIYVRCSFWHSGRKGGCMRAVPVAMWRNVEDQKGFLEYTVAEMTFDKTNLIKNL